jgi:hypothetical protein
MAKSKTKVKPAAPPPANAWRNRITGYGEVDPTQLLANPKNWRIHPESQQEALGAVLDLVGWVQVAAIVNQRTGFVVDGHLRVSLAISRKEPSIPVGYVDLTDAEEDLILASFDPISGAAVTDSEKLNALLGGLDFANASLDSLFAGWRPAWSGETVNTDTAILDEGQKTTLQDVTTEPEGDAGSGGAGSRDLGNTATQIKPVLYAKEIAVFESALRSTAERNRGKALIQICQFYLDHGRAEGQLDVQLEGLAAH